MMARKIEHAVDDMEIFKLTGCLSKCDKFHYAALPNTDFKDKGVANASNNEIPNFFIPITIPNGRNEVKEQVQCEFIMKICNNTGAAESGYSDTL